MCRSRRLCAGSCSDLLCAGPDLLQQRLPEEVLPGMAQGTVPQEAQQLRLRSSHLRRSGRMCASSCSDLLCAGSDLLQQRLPEEVLLGMAQGPVPQEELQ